MSYAVSFEGLADHPGTAEHHLLNVREMFAEMDHGEGSTRHAVEQNRLFSFLRCHFPDTHWATWLSSNAEGEWEFHPLEFDIGEIRFASKCDAAAFKLMFG